MLMLHFAGLRPPFNAPVMQEDVIGRAGRLLTVKEAAARLRMSAATVYALCEHGALRHIRLTTHVIRIAEQDLAEFIQLCRRGRAR